MPRGATLSADGFLTIGAVPPSPFPADPPPMPTQLDTFARKTSLGTPDEQAKAWQEAGGSAAFQAELQRLRQVLAREEAGNFIDVRLMREPQVIGEFVFRRQGAETLARYTSNPSFRGVTVDVDPARLAQLKRVWIARLEGGAPISSLSANRFAGKLELVAGVEEAEFRALAAERGWNLDDPMLSLAFPAPQPAAFAEPRLAGHVRSFAREETAADIRLLALGTGRIVLDDGCFRLADDNGEPLAKLVMFARTSQLFVDGEGYLAVRSSEGDNLYRVGERGAWGGPNAVDENSGDVRELRRRCGTDEIVNVAAPQSERLFALPYPLWVLDYAYTKDISYEAAWDEVIACIERQEARGRRGLEARDRCIKQYNGWDYTGDTMPPSPGT